ncbi:MAG: sprT domain-containing protein, partial [Micavibrio aeruginosavorus]
MAYGHLVVAYAYFNESLFAGTLPGCLITMQRKQGAYGFFHGNRFGSRDRTEITDEIALNPAMFATRDDRAILSTLVHEMAHLWQHHFGKPSGAGYHNREWSAKMVDIG